MGTLRKITGTTTKKEKVHKRLTIAELRNCKGFENYTDEEAEKTIQTLERLSILFYQLYRKTNQRKQNLILLKQGKDDNRHQRNAA